MKSVAPSACAPTQAVVVCPRDSHQARALGLDDKVQEVYTGVGKVLSRYTVGKLPKAFKIIPNLSNWEEVLGPRSCSLILVPPPL